jgi:hypothetical protein
LEQQRQELPRVEPQPQHARQPQQQYRFSFGLFPLAFNIMDGVKKVENRPLPCSRQIGTKMSGRVPPRKSVLVKKQDSNLKTPIFFL